MERIFRGLLIAVLAWSSRSVSAQSVTASVVVESEHDQVRASAVRSKMSECGVNAVRVGQGAPAVALTIVFERPGAPTLFSWQVRGGALQSTRANAPSEDSLDWTVRQACRIARGALATPTGTPPTARTVSSEVLNPWGESPRANNRRSETVPSEVTDPWAEVPRERRSIGSLAGAAVARNSPEILDPWSRRTPQARSEVLDPWNRTSESAENLSRPNRRRRRR